MLGAEFGLASLGKTIGPRQPYCCIDPSHQVYTEEPES